MGAAGSLRDEVLNKPEEAVAPQATDETEEPAAVAEEVTSEMTSDDGAEATPVKPPRARKPLEQAPHAAKGCYRRYSSRAGSSSYGGLKFLAHLDVGNVHFVERFPMFKIAMGRIEALDVFLCVKDAAAQALGSGLFLQKI